MDRGALAAAAVLALVAAPASAAPPARQRPIDRRALVSRHDPRVRAVDFTSPLTVGNGGFAFTMDATGLQTFVDAYHEHGIPLETQARWAWASDPNPRGDALADADEDYALPDGRTQRFPTNAASPAGDWLRRNPHVQPLGRLGLEWDGAGGAPLVAGDVTDVDQRLDLWTGVVTSRYRLGGTPVEVTTGCDPDSDTLAVVVRSPWVAAGALRARLAFPRGYDPVVKNGPGFDWSQPDAHRSTLADPRTVVRDVGGLRYVVRASRPLRAAGPHAFVVEAERGADTLAFTIAFARDAPSRPRSVSKVLAASARHWERFWRAAAALDLEGSTNPSAPVLEGRVVLSQYLTAVQLAGGVPPQESGLTCSTWYGKHHTEMIWWHAAHFALWNHPELLARNLEWYRARLPEARALARSRGLRGARWAKMVGPDGRESPGGNPLIVWNQPHAISLAELLYRRAPTPATLARYRDLVLETADALASMAWLDPRRGQYVLGPPLWIAQEIHDPRTSRNPAFELAYWRYALGVAQRWRERLGLARDPRWEDVIARLAPLPVRDGLYVALESDPDTWQDAAARRDHPSLLMALGFLPESPAVDRATMDRTLDAVLARWDWEGKIWGWDYPMIAMTATRLGRPQTAVEILLRDGPNNRYAPNGHCPQRGDAASGRPEIAAYLPANGALLSAVALMVAGWDGCTVEHPGFPHDGTWRVRAEGWSRLP